jgi:hypothetical protein
MKSEKQGFIYKEYRKMRDISEESYMKCVLMGCLSYILFHIYTQMKCIINCI